MPSLAHTVSCLARTVPKPFPLPYSQYLSLLEFCLAFPVYSRLNSSRGVPADEASCMQSRGKVNKKNGLPTEIVGPFLPFFHQKS